MQIITGYTGESHVTSADDASLYRGIIGIDDYVLSSGSKFQASIIDNNTVRIMDGDLLIQGHQARIKENDYNEVTIDNGTPGQKRNDLIVARYLKNTETGIESITLEVVKGTPGAAAIDPEIIQEDLKTGGTQRDYPLYRVALDGISLSNLTTMFNVIPTFSSHLAESAKKHITESGINPTGDYIKFDDGTLICAYSTPSYMTVEALTIKTNTLVFPAGFSTRPSVVISPMFDTGSAYLVGTVRAVSNTNVTFSLYNSYPTSPLLFGVQMIAVGRWR